MVHAFLLAAVVHVSASQTSLQGQLCRRAAQTRLDNYPPNSSAHDTETVHAAIVYVDNRLGGFLYVTRAGSIWYQTGLINPKGLIQARNSDIGTVNAVLEKPIESRGTSQLSAKNLISLITGNISIRSCY